MHGGFWDQRIKFPWSPKLSHAAQNPGMRKGLSSSHQTGEGKRQRLERLNWYEGQMKMRGEMQNALRRDINVQLIRVATLMA